MKKLQLTKDTLGTLNADELSILHNVNGGMAAPSGDAMGTCGTCGCTVSISWRGTCSDKICFPSTPCSLRGC